MTKPALGAPAVLREAEPLRTSHQGASNHADVAGLVYVSALAPDTGETTAQQYDGFAPTPDFVIDVGDDGFGVLAPDTFKAGFAADTTDADAAFMRDSHALYMTQAGVVADVIATAARTAS